MCVSVVPCCIVFCCVNVPQSTCSVGGGHLYYFQFFTPLICYDVF